MSPVAFERRKGRSRFATLSLPNLATCPAAAYIAETDAGSGVRCRITRSSVTAGKDPSSLARYCFGSYGLCPVWREEKERIWAARKQPLVPEEQDKLAG